MVDINLFDDEPEEEQQGHEDKSFDSMDGGGDLSLNDEISDDLGNAFDDELTDDSGGGFEDESATGGFDNDLGGDESIDDALGFDDDFADEDNLDDAGMMEEDLSGLDDDMGIIDEDDYDFGGSGAKKNMKFIWMILIIAAVIVVGVIYKDMIMTLMPGRNKPASKPTRITQTAKVPAKAPGHSSAAQSAAAGDSAGTTAGRPVQQQATKNLTAISIKLFNDLSGKNQFNMMIVDKDRFAVEYASTSSGAAGAFAERIKALTEAAAVVSSPEDGHTVNGKTYYFGVISGKFDPVKMAASGGGAGFQNDAAFINTVKSKIQQQGLTLSSEKKRSSQSSGSQNKTNFEFVLEGEKVKAITFLQSLSTMGGNWEPVKIRISPADLNDFSAARVKLVLDVTALVGNSPAAPAG